MGADGRRNASRAGMLCRLQGYVRDATFKALQDAPLFLQAQKLGLTVPTANIAEFDYLLQLVPAGRLLFCSACRQTSIQPRGAVVIPPRPKEAIDDDPVASHGIEDAMLLVAWDQREGARHFTEADGAVFEFRNKRHGLHRVVRGDVACDRQKIIARVSGQGNSH